MPFKFENLRVWQDGVQLSTDINILIKKFLGYSIRSGIEVVGCLYLARKRELIDEKTFKTFYVQTETLIISIQALRNSIN